MQRCDFSEVVMPISGAGSRVASIILAPCIRFRHADCHSVIDDGTMIGVRCNWPCGYTRQDIDRVLSRPLDLRDGLMPLLLTETLNQVFPAPAGRTGSHHRTLAALTAPVELPV